MRSLKAVGAIVDRVVAVNGAPAVRAGAAERQ
jgi:hypothetical protein